jgi:two-component system response regulator GlrR
VNPPAVTRPLPYVAAPPIRLQRCVLTVQKGPRPGASTSLDDGPVVIGSSNGCDLVIADDTVSARHCEIALRGERLIVRDLGSTNGVFVNSIRVLEAFLEPGAQLQLGAVILAVKAEADEEVEAFGGDEFGPLYGASPQMRAIFSQLQALADSSAPLLIEGETGTGKDLTAEAVHRASPRSAQPFVVMDCGAVSAALIEAELFGHEKGAFTGAGTARAGLAEAASGGTLVLDELGELPLELQPKLLRVVEKNEVRRVGSNVPVPVDLRIIGSTHRTLRAEVKAGRFREDLYYRLSALRLRLPALRERPDDLPGLVDRLLQQHGSARRFEQLSYSDRSLLLSHRWPGNVRELRNVVERLLTFPATPASGLVEREPVVAQAPKEFLPLPAARERAQFSFERMYVMDVLARASGSVTESAKLAGVSRQFLQRLLQKHGLRGRET